MTGVFDTEMNVLVLITENKRKIRTMYEFSNNEYTFTTNAIVMTVLTLKAEESSTEMETCCCGLEWYSGRRHTPVEPGLRSDGTWTRLGIRNLPRRNQPCRSA